MHNVGFVLIVEAIFNCLSSFALGIIVQHVGRVAIYLTATLLNVIAIAVMFTWAPVADQKWVLFVLAALWGVTDAVWQTQINGTEFYFIAKLS